MSARQTDLSERQTAAAAERERAAEAERQLSVVAEKLEGMRRRAQHEAKKRKKLEVRLRFEIL